MKTLKLKTILIATIFLSFISCEKDGKEQDSVVSKEEEELKELNDVLNESEESGSDSNINCDFKGFEEREYESGHYVGVSTIISNLGADATVEWSVNGSVVETPTAAGVPTRTLRILKVDDYVSQSGMVEVCYKASSEVCDTIGDCITVNYKG